MERSHEHARRFPGLNVAVPLHEWIDVPCSGVILWDKAAHPPRPLPFGTMRRSACRHRWFASIHWAPRRCGRRRGQRQARRLAGQLLHLRPVWIVFAEPAGFRDFCRLFRVEPVREHVPMPLPGPLTASPGAGVVTAGLVRQLHAVYFLWTPLRPRLHCPCGSGAKIGRKGGDRALFPQSPPHPDKPGGGVPGSTGANPAQEEAACQRSI